MDSGYVLRGRRLLILGAGMESVPIYKRAKELGVYTIAIDHIPASPAKKIADAAFDIDGKDVKALTVLVRRERIDGILLGCADPLTSYYVELCEATGKPCYIERRTLDFFTNKNVFRKICKQADIPVVPSFFSGKHWEKDMVRNIRYPAIVKPAVCRGGNGVVLCRSEKEASCAFEKAAAISDNHEAILEKYMDLEDIGINYIIINGVPYLLPLSDRKVLRESDNISAVTYGNRFPSLQTEFFGKKYHDKFVKMFHALGIRYGVFNAQAFVDGKNVYPYDPSGIINGELVSRIFLDVFGLDIIGLFIRYALTGRIEADEVAFPLRAEQVPCIESLWILLNPGKIGKIVGKEKLESNDGVADYMFRLNEGDIVTESMYQTEKSTLARIWIKADSREALERLSNAIRKEVLAFDDEGELMVYAL